MTEVEERELDYGVVERRTYENGQLVDVRKIYPSMNVKRGQFVKTLPGSSGGHQF